MFAKIASKGHDAVCTYEIRLLFCFLQETAAFCGISAMPTFYFYLKGDKVQCLPLQLLVNKLCYRHTSKYNVQCMQHGWIFVEEKF